MASISVRLFFLFLRLVIRVPKLPMLLCLPFDHPLDAVHHRLVARDVPLPLAHVDRFLFENMRINHYVTITAQLIINYPLTVNTPAIRIRHKVQNRRRIFRRLREHSSWDEIREMIKSMSPLSFV